MQNVVFSTTYPLRLILCSFIYVHISPLHILNMFQHTQIHFQRQIWIHVCNWLALPVCIFSLRRTLVKMKLYFSFLFILSIVLFHISKWKLDFFSHLIFLNAFLPYLFSSPLTLQFDILICPKIKSCKYFRLLFITKYELLSFQSDLVVEFLKIYLFNRCWIFNFTFLPFLNQNFQIFKNRSQWWF